MHRRRLAGRLAPAALASLALGVAGQARAQPVASPSQQVTPSSQPVAEPVSEPREPDRVLLFGLRTGVTFSDNLLFTPDGGDRRSGFALEASPYAIVQSNTPRLRADVRYILRNIYRTQGEEFTLAKHSLDGRATAALAGDWLFLDAYGRIANVNASPFGPFSYDPVIAGSNLGTFRSFGFSPYVRSQVPGYFDYELRYRYSWTDVNTSFAVRTLQALSASVGSGNRLGRWQATWFGDAQRLQRDGLPDIDRRASVASLSYLLTQEVRVGALLNWESIDLLRNESGETSGFGYGAFVDWRPNSRIATNLTWQRRYYGDTSSASASWRLRRFFLQANYSRSVLSSADASLLYLDPFSIVAGAPSGLGAPGTGNPFFNLLSNPLASALIQQQFLLYGATPFDLAFLSSALVVDRRTTLGASLNGVQNDLYGFVFHSDRQSLLQQTGGTSTGAALAGLFSGELRQTGLDIGYTHRMDARTSIFVNARRTIFDVDGLVGGVIFPGRTTSTLASTGVSLRLTPDTIASLLVRRSTSTRENAPATTENAIVGVLDVRF